MQVPYYTSTPFPGAHLILDSNGLPVYQGQATAMFTVCKSCDQSPDIRPSYLLPVSHSSCLPKGSRPLECGQRLHLSSEDRAVWSRTLWNTGTHPSLLYCRLGSCEMSCDLQDEVMDGYLQEQANEHGYLLAACDWWGMAQEDLAAIVPMLSYNISNFRIIPDRLTQGVVNALLLMKMLKVLLQPLPSHPTLTSPPLSLFQPSFCPSLMAFVLVVVLLH